MKPQEKLLIFDLDGTLIDSAEAIHTCVNDTLKYFELPLIDRESTSRSIGEGMEPLFQKIFSEVLKDPARSKVLWDYFYKRYEELCNEDTKCFEGVFEFLDNCDYQIAICTNKPHHFALQSIDHAGLSKYNWVDIVGAGKLEQKKPSPIGLQHIMNLAKLGPEQTIMIGDGLPDAQAARAAGTKYIACTFGYAKTELLLEYKPEGCLENYSELHSLLENM